MNNTVEVDMGLDGNLLTLPSTMIIIIINQIEIFAFTWQGRGVGEGGPCILQ